VLHDEGGPWQSTLQVNDRIGLTTSKDILQAVGEGHGRPVGARARRQCLAQRARDRAYPV
jgi:hypothetical protein